MKEMNRRDFIRNVAIGGAVLGLGNAVFHKPLKALASGKYDIGQCKSVRIKCVSELGWHLAPGSGHAVAVALGKEDERL